MRMSLRAAALAIGSGIGLLACYPEQPTESGDLASVVTLYDVSFQFGDAATYYIVIPDSVVHLGPAGGSDPFDHTYDSLIVARTAANMNVRGYTRVLDPATADLILSPAVLVTNNYDFESADWCVVWGWAYPGCAGWVPDYPTDVVGYEYSAGTIIIPMADATVAAPPVVWNAALNGVLNGNTPGSLAAAITDGIDQAFSQSTYLYHTATP